MIPSSQCTMRMKFGGPLVATTTRSLLLVVNTSVAEKVRYYSHEIPFGYDLGEGVAIQLSSTLAPLLGLTWGRLKTIICGLWLRYVEKQQILSCCFEIYDVEEWHTAVRVGWNTILKSNGEYPIELLPFNTNKERALPLPPAVDLPALNASDARPVYSEFFRLAGKY